MTTVDVLYRYGAVPSQAAVMSLARMREVYGVRSLHLDETAKTVRIEYDATRFAEPTVRQMVRRSGIDVVEDVPLVPAVETTAAL